MSKHPYSTSSLANIQKFLELKRQMVADLEKEIRLLEKFKRLLMERQQPLRLEEK